MCKQLFTKKDLEEFFMNVQMKELELLEKIQGKYSDQEVDQIIRKKYKKWQKSATEKMSHYDKQERIFLAYKEAVQQFSDVKLPIEACIIRSDCF